MTFSWPRVKLKDCCTVVSGATPRRNVPKFWGGDIAWVTPKDLSDLDTPVLKDTPEKITDAGLRSCSATVLPVGSVLFSSRAPIGLIAITGRRMCTNQGFKSLIPGKHAAGDYLYWCMRHLTPRIAHLGRGATFKEVSKEIINEFEVPLPPMDEQRRIAAILDKADAIRRKRRETIRLTDDFLRSVFLDMFGDPVTNPKGLPQKPISEFGQVVTGNTPSRSRPDYFGNHIEWIKSDNINTPYHFITRSSEGLSSTGRQVARTVPKDSILVTCIAGSKDCIGNAAMTDREVAFNQQINAIIPSKETEGLFLYAQVLIAKGLVQAASTQSMKGMVSKSAFSAVSLLAPSSEKQQAFSSIAMKAITMQQKQRLAEEDAGDVFGSLVQRAFSGRVNP